MCLNVYVYISVGVEPIVCIKGKLHQLVSQTQHISREDETAELRVFFSKSRVAIAAQSTIAYEIIT